MNNNTRHSTSCRHATFKICTKIVLSVICTLSIAYLLKCLQVSIWINREITAPYHFFLTPHVSPNVPFHLHATQTSTIGVDDIGTLCIHPVRKDYFRAIFYYTDEEISDSIWIEHLSLCAFQHQAHADGTNSCKIITRRFDQDPYTEDGFVDGAL